MVTWFSKVPLIQIHSCQVIMPYYVSDSLEMVPVA